MAIIFRNINGNPHTPIDTETSEVAFDKTDIKSMSAAELKGRLQRELPDEKPVIQGKDAKSQAAPENKTTIKEQIVAEYDKIKNTKPVAAIPKEEITGDINKAITALKEKLSKNGGVVVREGLGNIQVSARLKDAVSYIKTPAEIAAFTAIPAVIQDGVLVGVHKNHKGREYASYTIAGKVSFEGKEGVVAVVVRNTTGNFYKVHRVLTPDGKDFEIEKDTD